MTTGAAGDSKFIQLLRDAQLEYYCDDIRTKLQVFQVEHFSTVTPKDLKSIGMPQPAALRLLRMARKYFPKVQHPKSSIFRLLFNNVMQTSLNDKSGGKDLKNAVACIIPSNELQQEHLLGEGQFGAVYQAVWMKANGMMDVAVKVVKEEYLATEEGFKDFLKEVDIMLCLKHDNLILLHGITISPTPSLVLELAPNGCLLDHLRETGSKTLLSDLSRHALDVSLGMQYLENHKFIHRDLACRNLLLGSKMEVKIGDFGLMRVLAPQNDYYTMAPQSKVAFAWSAPEALLHRRFSHESDTYMLGVTLWEMYSLGDDPWPGMNGGEVAAAISREGKRLPQPSLCPNIMYRLMLQCWLLEPSARPSMEAIVHFLTAEGRLSILVYRPALLGGDIDFTGVDMSTLQLDDRIIVLQGSDSNPLWRGQNCRTAEIGTFRRSHCVTLAQQQAMDKKKTGKPRVERREISSPLPATFRQTLHASANDNGSMATSKSSSLLSSAFDIGAGKSNATDLPMKPLSLPTRTNDKLIAKNDCTTFARETSATTLRNSMRSTTRINRNPFVDSVVPNDWVNFNEATSNDTNRRIAAPQTLVDKAFNSTSSQWQPMQDSYADSGSMPYQAMPEVNTAQKRVEEEPWQPTFYRPYQANPDVLHAISDTAAGARSMRTSAVFDEKRHRAHIEAIPTASVRSCYVDGTTGTTIFTPDSPSESALYDGQLRDESGDLIKLETPDRVVVPEDIQRLLQEELEISKRQENGANIPTTNEDNLPETNPFDAVERHTRLMAIQAEENKRKEQEGKYRSLAENALTETLRHQQHQSLSSAQQTATPNLVNERSLAVIPTTNTSVAKQQRAADTPQKTATRAEEGPAGSGTAAAGVPPSYIPSDRLLPELQQALAVGATRRSRPEGATETKPAYVMTAAEKEEKLAQLVELGVCADNDMMLACLREARGDVAKAADSLCRQLYK